MNTSITLQIRLQWFLFLSSWQHLSAEANLPKKCPWLVEITGNHRQVAAKGEPPRLFDLQAATRCLSPQQALCKSVFVVCLIVSKWECGYLFCKTQTAFCVWDSCCNSFLTHLLSCSPENVRNMLVLAPALLVSFWFHLKLQQCSPFAHNRLYIHQITHLYLNNTLLVLHFPSYCL